VSLHLLLPKPNQPVMFVTATSPGDDVLLRNLCSRRACTQARACDMALNIPRKVMHEQIGQIGSAGNVSTFCRMDAYLQFLTKKASSVDNTPHRIRGRVMHVFDLCPVMLHASHPDGTDVWLHAGMDVHSCTASAATIAFWLSPPAPPVPARTLPELAADHRAVGLATLASDAAVAALVQPLFAEGRGDAVFGKAATLLVFSTAPHKFAVLCVDNTAVLLQSNQDDTRGGKRFTLSEWLRGSPRRLSPAQLSEMIRQLASAAIGVADHEAVFTTYFGGAFKRGDVSEYWVARIPVTTADVAA
jgi:hypothetical protein